MSWARRTVNKTHVDALNGRRQTEIRLTPGQPPGHSAMTRLGAVGNGHSSALEVDTEAKEMMDAVYERMTKKSNENRTTLSLWELLALTNDAEQDQINKGLYLLTNEVGTGDNPVGATAAASWWHRNFRMFARIQRHALVGENKRVLVIGGQGHTAILKDLLAFDERLNSVDVVPFL